jgi:hypothetical protein
MLLVGLALMPILILRYTLYSVLAMPLWPVIEKLGWVYSDKPWYLTPGAAVFSAGVWALPLYLLLCTVRSFSRK